VTWQTSLGGITFFENGLPQAVCAKWMSGSSIFLGAANGELKRSAKPIGFHVREGREQYRAIRNHSHKTPKRDHTTKCMKLTKKNQLR